MDRLKRYCIVLLAFVCLVHLPGCANAMSNITSVSSKSSADSSAIGSGDMLSKSISGGPNDAEAMIDITVLLDGQEYAAKLYNNETARVLVGLFPLEIQMEELNGNEKYCYLPEELPTNSESVGTIHTGDIMLYGPDCLVLFYKSLQTAYSYTRLGYIEYPEGLFELAGNSSVSATFESE